MSAFSLLRQLYRALGEHRAVEREIFRLLERFLDAPYRRVPPAPARTLPYAQRNFFSILFLAVYTALGIPPERRLLYGVVNHSLRGIVTGADNLLDDEYKELLPLALPASGVRFKSIMHILLFDRFLFWTLDDAWQRGMLTNEERLAVQKELFSAMVPIGEREAAEEDGAYEILPPEDILSSVHMYRGGNLLRLAFIAPRLLERNNAAAVRSADQGIYSIGMALQAIDDLTDFYEDLEGRKSNYFVSLVQFNGAPAERALLRALKEGTTPERPPVERAFAVTASQVMEQAIGEALKGFGLLEQAGFRISEREAFETIRFLFTVRGVKHLWDLLPEGRAGAASLTGNDRR